MIIKLAVIACVSALSFSIVRAVFFRFKWFHPIFGLAPDRHHQKVHIPAVGGIGLAIGILATIFIMPDSNLTRIACVTWLWFAVIGWIDDALAMIRHQNRGLSASQKFGLQWVGALGIIVAMAPQIYGWGMVFLSALWIVGFSNAANLTDGLDGLLAGLSILTAVGLAMLAFKMGNLSMVWHIVSVIGILGVFLLWNFHPAKMFMGDGGSLALGAWMAIVSILLKAPLVLLPLGLVYIIETASVVIQVGYFKLTRRRIYRMAPLHHHFELLGLSEVKVVVGAYLLGCIGLLIFWIHL